MLPETLDNFDMHSSTNSFKLKFFKLLFTILSPKSIAYCQSHRWSCRSYATSEKLRKFFDNEKKAKIKCFELMISFQ